MDESIIETTVIVDDGQILVLGGLLEDALRESNQKVPFLGSIPVLGALFRSQKTEKIKTNLMIFIKPTILRDTATTAFETNAKYNMIREVQRGNQGEDIQLMPGRQRPILPDLNETPDNENSDNETQNSEPQDDATQ